MRIDAIVTWQDWCDSFQNIDTFKGIIYEILYRHNLRIDKIENTFPGTNAVFKVGEYIIKIFVPTEVKPWDEDDYAKELKTALYNKQISKYTTKLLAYGIIEKRFLWKYLVFKFFEGKHMYEIIDQLTSKEKQIVASQIRGFLTDFNVKPKELYDNTDVINRIISGNRWNFLNEVVKKELFGYIKSLDISDSVIVHGDITGDNVLINKNDIVIIDFGDSCIAPFYYEYAPIILDLFKLDKELISLFFDGEIDDLIKLVIKSIMIHDFGGDFAAKLLHKYQVASLADLQDLLYSEIKNRLQ